MGIALECVERLISSNTDQVEAAMYRGGYEGTLLNARFVRLSKKADRAIFRVIDAADMSTTIIACTFTPEGALITATALPEGE